MDSSWAPDLGSENHTRFLNLLGVVGRVDIRVLFTIRL